uniref:Fibronectin type-III domain-containing protein n=1 Tax=Oncorhynchus mykiss TaxID=8022 RepID=A0A8C7VKP6_ONCMY
MAFYLLITLGFRFISAESLLPQPQNVEVVSYNMDAIVKWEAPLTSLKNLTYTAEYRMTSTASFYTVCKATKEHRCDFGKLPSCHGNYKFRVRIELEGNTSSWAETPNFSLKKGTVIGPPNVTLVTKGGALGAVEVNIQNPVLKISSLNEAYSKVEYNIRYWKKTDKKDVSEREMVTEQRVRLKPLEPNTRYCVQVQVYIPMPHNNTGQYSKAACVMSTTNNTTTDGERRLSEGLVVSLVTVAVAFPLLLLVPWVIYKGKRFLHPKVKLPEHLKQHLIDSHEYPYLASQITSPLQEKYDQISALCEENPYNVLTDIPEDNLYHVDSGVSVEMPKYYNAVAENAIFDMPYKNI